MRQRQAATQHSQRVVPERCGNRHADEVVSGGSFRDPCNDPFHRLADVAIPPIRAQRRGVFAHGDAVDQLVKVLDALQHVVDSRCASCRVSADCLLASAA